MKIVYSIYFYFKYILFLRSNLKNALNEFLTEKSKISFSYLKSELIITNYNTRLIKNEELIFDYINRVDDLPIKIDYAVFKTNKVVFKSQKIPEYFNYPQKNINQDMIPLCLTEKREIKFWNPKNSSALILTMPQGAGKTVFLRKFLGNIVENFLGNDKCYQQIIIIDPKCENDFLHLKNDRVQIINTLTEAISVLQKIERQADANTARRTLFVAEEYLQFCRTTVETKDKNKEFIRILNKVIEFYRSKNISLILTSQHQSSGENYIPLDNCIRILSSPNKQMCEQLSIQKNYSNRADIKFLKYIYYNRGDSCLARF